MKKNNLNITGSKTHTVWKLPLFPNTDSIRAANKIHIFGQEFYPIFSDEGDTLISDPIELDNFKCRDKVDFSLSVKKETGNVNLVFDYNAINNGTRSYLSDSTMELLLTIPNTDEYTLSWDYLSKNRPTTTVSGLFLDWSSGNADLFLNSVSEILIRSSSVSPLMEKDVECFLELVQNLDWGKNDKMFPEKQFSILAENALCPNRNQFFKSPLRYRYSDKFVGFKAKDLAFFCLASGKFPNEKDTKQLCRQKEALTNTKNELLLE